MTDNTYTISEALDLAYPNYEFPFTAITGHPYLEFIAMVGIYNGVASGDDLYIKRININNLSAQNSSLPTKFNIQRITNAPTDGSTVTVTKHDSAIASLASQIEIRKYPNFTAGTTMMELPDFPNQSTNISNQAICSRTYGNRTQGIKGSASIRSFHDASAQGYILRESQGLLLAPITTPFSHQIETNIMFSTSDGTYSINESIIPNTKEQGIISIWNGSGSGQIITVNEIQVYDNGEVVPPYFTIELIDGLYNGDDITPIQNDSLNGALPSQILMRKNCNVMVAGTRAGAIIVTPQLMRTNKAGLNMGESQTSLSFPNRNEYILNKKGDSSYIHLGNGNGIAIIKKSIGTVPGASGIGKYEVFIEMTKVDQATGSTTAAEISSVF